MLRQHARGTQLLSWCQALLPLARKMGALAAAGGTSMRGMQCRALEGQLWACLPAFASYPTDLPEAFRLIIMPIHHSQHHAAIDSL